MTTRVNADQIEYIPEGVGAVARTVQAELREQVKVTQFPGVDPTGLTDSTVGIQNALDSSIGKTVHFPDGTYIIGSTIRMPSNIHLTGNKRQSVIKLQSKSWAASGGLMFELVLDADVRFDSLTFDGNKGSVGTTRSPLIVAYLTQRTTFSNCTFQNVEGICANISNDTDDTEFLYCNFLNCGGHPSNSDGYRKQAIAFSSDGVHRSRGIKIIGCYFRGQGLDCISLNDCDDVVIANNIAIESYTLVYNNPLPSITRNLVISGNVVRKCSEFGAGTDVAPNAFDLPSVDGLVVSGNTMYDIDTCGIGLYSGTKNATVTGNTIVNPMMSGTLAFRAGLFIGDTNDKVALTNILVTGNTISNTAGTSMDYGIVIKSDTLNLCVKDNPVLGANVGRYGWYSTDPFSAYLSPLTTTTQLSASARVVDVNLSINDETVHGDLSLGGVFRLIPMPQPISANKGDCYFDSALDKVRVFNGTAWVNLF